MNSYLDIKDEVAEALAGHRPVLALESTILSHGMPYPDNLHYAMEVDRIVRGEGVIPATIAVMNGRLKVGLDLAEVELMCKAKDVVKVSRRDLPIVLASGEKGATTVASSMIVADLVGIRVFSTGGIGGVHRGAPQSFDISADLQELAHTSVAVVCSGAKSILDIGLTLEYLETMGVPVIGYQTDLFPGFYSSKSGFPVDYNATNPEMVANIIDKKWELGLKGGVVVANPVPEEYALDPAEVETVTHAALDAANRSGIHGKRLTPFLLSFIKSSTEGASLTTNEQLGFHNALVGAKIAVAFAKLNAQKEKQIK